MCGIYGYTGGKRALPLLLRGLQELEYRGYDSAGVVVSGLGSLKAVGTVSNLVRKCNSRLEHSGTCGIAHTRWATHGEPTEENAHPHSDCKGNVWVVHNGIIENHTALKKRLAKAGHRFLSGTDTEILAHLIEDELATGRSFFDAVRRALLEVEGAYAIAAFLVQEPDTIVVARMGSPLLIGIGDDEHFIASDAGAVLNGGSTNKVLYLSDGEIALVRRSSYSLETLQSQTVSRQPEILAPEEHAGSKLSYEHFMQKEIMEQPEVLERTIAGRIIGGGVVLPELSEAQQSIFRAKNIVIVGCGTAYHAGLVGEYMLEDYAGIPVQARIASEFRYRKPVLARDTLLIAISQSGETTDTLYALREGKKRGAHTIAIVNVVNSTIAREADVCLYTRAGAEIGVASTKAFLSQLAVLSLLTAYTCQVKRCSHARVSSLVSELASISGKVAKILAGSLRVKDIAEAYAEFRNFLYIGRNYHCPIAFEGALKLKEVSYVHAEGCGAGEMKHGPIAMIDELFPTVALVPEDPVYEKMLSNIEEIKARKGRVLAVTTEGVSRVSALADHTLCVPKVVEPLQPILSVIPLQLLAYHVGVLRGCNVDKPRNLAKSVTVE